MKKTSATSLSTCLLAAVLVVSASTFITLFPYHVFGSAATSPPPPPAAADSGGIVAWQRGLSKAAEGVGLAGPVLAGLLIWLGGWRAGRKAARDVGAASPWPSERILEAVAAPDVLLQTPVFAKVEFRTQGDPSRIIDDGGPLESSPRALQWREGVRTRVAVLIPAAYIRRFAAHPHAWQAVITHEMAHFANHDIRLLYLGDRLLRAVAWVGLAGFFLSLAVSVLADAPPVSLASVAASLSGKAYLGSAFMLLLGMAYLLRRLRDWREALADAVAAELCGTEALVAARQLAAGGLAEGASHGQGLEPTAEQRAQAYVLTPLDLAFFGFLAAVIGNTLASPLAYLANFVFTEGASNTSLSSLAAVVLNLVGFLSSFMALRVQAPRPEAQGGGRPWRALMVASFCLVAGSIAAQWLTQAAPLIATSIGMPEGYDRVLRADPVPLTLSTLLTAGVTASFWVFFAMIALVVERLAGGIWAAILPGMIWYALGPLESAAFPTAAHGWITVGAAASAVPLTWLWLRLRGRRPDLRHAGLLGGLLPVAPFLLAGWLFWGDVGHLAASASRAGVACLNAGQTDEAVRLFRLAARLSPAQTEGTKQLAAVLSALPGHLDEAVVLSEQALAHPLLYSWQERFSLLQLAGLLRLQRRGTEDVPAAIRHFEAATAMHLRNSRLPEPEVASMLFNKACALCLSGQPGREAMLALLEAALLDARLAQAALTDGDLTPLHLTQRPPPAPETMQLIESLPRQDIEGLRTLLDGPLGEDQFLDFASRLIRIIASPAVPAAGAPN